MRHSNTEPGHLMNSRSREADDLKTTRGTPHAFGNVIKWSMCFSSQIKGSIWRDDPKPALPAGRQVAPHCSLCAVRQLHGGGWWPNAAWPCPNPLHRNPALALLPGLYITVSCQTSSASSAALRQPHPTGTKWQALSKGPPGTTSD